MSSKNKLPIGQVIFRANAEIEDPNGTRFKLPPQRNAEQKDFKKERWERKERMRKLRENEQ